eukprot:COSAG02_NODE_6887_length_3307_cov_2.238155_6_plen_95_part_00
MAEEEGGATHTCTPYLAGRRAEDLGRRALGLLEEVGAVRWARRRAAGVSASVKSEPLASIFSQLPEYRPPSREPIRAERAETQRSTTLLLPVCL